jgi:hypothetical protein
MRPGKLLTFALLCAAVVSAFGCGPSGPKTVQPNTQTTPTPTTGAGNEEAKVP